MLRTTLIAVALLASTAAHADDRCLAAAQRLQAVVESFNLKAYSTPPRLNDGVVNFLLMTHGFDYLKTLDGAAAGVRRVCPADDSRATMLKSIATFKLQLQKMIVGISEYTCDDHRRIKALNGGCVYAEYYN